MTSEKFDDSIIQCPICLSSIVLPITLSCGHSYCEPCIKHDNFQYTKKACPICRKKIKTNINQIGINLMLDQILEKQFALDQKYTLRRLTANKNRPISHRLQIWGTFKRKLRALYPWIIILLLLYHLIRIKVNVFNLLFEKYKDKALKLAQTIEKENSLDFKFLLFSQFMRILFSNMIIH